MAYTSHEGPLYSGVTSTILLFSQCNVLSSILLRLVLFLQFKVWNLWIGDTKWTSVCSHIFCGIFSFVSHARTVSYSQAIFSFRLTWPACLRTVGRDQRKRCTYRENTHLKMHSWAAGSNRGPSCWEWRRKSPSRRQHSLKMRTVWHHDLLSWLGLCCFNYL